MLNFEPENEKLFFTVPANVSHLVGKKNLANEILKFSF